MTTTSMCASFKDIFKDIFCISKPTNVKPVARHLSSLKSKELVQQIFD